MSGNIDISFKRFKKNGLTKTTLYDIRNYLMVFLIILFEDSPFFTLNNKQFFWFIIFLILFISNIKKKATYNWKIFVLVLWVWFLIAIQYILFGGQFTPAIIYKPFWLIYTPYLVFILMGIGYFKYLFNTIYFIAIYTSIIYLLQTFFPSIDQILNSLFKAIYPYGWSLWPNNIIIYSIPRDSGFFLMRNSGLFHEPGAYSIYLMLGIILNTYFTKKVFHWKNVFLGLVLLSTFSTTGYIMLFLFVTYAIIKARINQILKPILFIPIGILIFMVYRDTEFLQEKVDTQFENETESLQINKKSQRGRFYAFGMSVRAFLDYPITGKGIIYVHKYDVGEGGSFGYGFAGLLAMYGIIFGAFYIWFFYKGFIKMCLISNVPKLIGIYAFIIINLGLLTQIFFFHTPFIFFFMIGLFLPVNPIAKSLYKPRIYFSHYSKISNLNYEEKK